MISQASSISPQKCADGSLKGLNHFRALDISRPRKCKSNRKWKGDTCPYPKNCIRASFNGFVLFFNEILSKTVETAQHVYMVSTMIFFLFPASYPEGVMHSITASRNRPTFFPSVESTSGDCCVILPFYNISDPMGIGCHSVPCWRPTSSCSSNHEFVTCYHVMLPGLA